MKDMESNGDVFGNSPGIKKFLYVFYHKFILGVGKWEDKWKNSNINDQK